jgi:hypothetical protein
MIEIYDPTDITQPYDEYLRNYLGGENNVALTGTLRDTFHIFEVQWQPGASPNRISNVYIDHLFNATASNPIRIPSSALPVTLYSLGSGSPLQVDWVYVRQYRSPEPTTAVGAEEVNPTPVKLVDFNTTSLLQGIQLDWQTAQEVDLLGFNLYRAEESDGPQVKINPELIPGINPGLLKGNDYQYLDTTAEAGMTYYYWVEWVGISSSEFYGPVTGSLAPYKVFLPIGLK